MDPNILNSQVFPGLKEMTSDSDRDVQYYATVALTD